MSVELNRKILNRAAPQQAKKEVPGTLARLIVALFAKKSPLRGSTKTCSGELACLLAWPRIPPARPPGLLACRGRASPRATYLPPRFRRPEAAELPTYPPSSVQR